MTRRAFCRLFPGLAFAAALSPAGALAGVSSSQAPRTGLEPPDAPMKGRGIPAVGTIKDAYGNPVTPRVQEEAPRKRLPAGAYGGYGRKSAPERPLPDPGNDRPVW